MNTKKIFICLSLFLWLAVPTAVHATAQIPDLLIVNGDTLMLFCNPLEGYFTKEHPRPNDMYGLGSTACWRNYQAYFEIRQDSLFLTGIRLGNKGDSTDFYPLAKLFGEKTTPDGVFAFWVNYKLRCVDGECLYYIHMGYSSIYEYDIEYTVRHGLVKKKMIYDNRKTFVISEEHNGGPAKLLQTFLEQQIDYSILDSDEMETFIRVMVKKVDGKGRIKKVEIKGETRNQERAVRRAIKKVPYIYVLYYCGKPVKDLRLMMDLRIYASEDERLKQSPYRGPDVGEYEKERICDNYDVVGSTKYLVDQYRYTYEFWKDYLADTSATKRRYKNYFCQLFGDSLFYQHHYFMTLGDSALKYYYQYWDMTGDHEELYPEIVKLEQELDRPHNPKIVEGKNPEFVYLVHPEEMDATRQADPAHLYRRCRQVSYHLRGFGEDDLHKPLPHGIQEEWRMLILRGRYLEKTSPVLVKVTYDGKDARISWRVAKEIEYKTYPGLEHFRHGIRSEGERIISSDEWNRLKTLADEAGMDTLCLVNDYFTSPPAIYNVEHRTVSDYHVVNDYNHPYYSEEINPAFWPYRTFCKYLLSLADPSLPFDCDDEHYRPSEE